MLKGFCTILPLAALIVGGDNLSAQVYRCETAAGMIYSDMPCGESAEEMELDVFEPVTEPEEMPAMEQEEIPETVSSDVSLETETQAFNQFLKILRNQRKTQIDEFDRNLTDLRIEASSAEFLNKDDESKAAITARIDALETSRASVVDEYDALITEAERRME